MSSQLKFWCLVDAIGALFSIFGLCVLTALPTEIVGLPRWFYAVSAGAACLLAVNSFRCWRAKPSPTSQQLLAIGALNLVYCSLSLGFGLLMIRAVTPLSAAYFALELAVVVPLAGYEIFIAKKAM